MLKQFIAAAFILTGVPLNAGAEAKLENWQVKALKKVKAEKSVLDARWRSPEANMLYVSMMPNGYSRDGFAQSLCIFLIESGAPDGSLKTVWIYDPQSYNDGGKSLGVAACR